MKKGIVILIMILICSVYFFSVKRTVKDIEKEGVMRIDRLLQKEKTKLETEYPQTVEQLLKINNELIKLEYSRDMMPELAPLAVEIARLMYSSELLMLNDAELQVELLVEELARNLENELYVIGSEIQDISYKQDSELLTAAVLHYTTNGDVKRDYKLREEEGKWKIYNWEDSPLPRSENKVEEENETN